MDYVPPPEAARHSRFTIYTILFLAMLIIGAWTLYTQPGISGKADAVGYAICHRIPERSFEAFGRALPLCARCTGIYLGVMTGLSVYVASGRTRAAFLPNWKVGIGLGLFVGVLGLDGINSYLTFFPWYTPLYEPQNWLRLTTGVFTGITLITMVYPIFHQSMWADGGQATAPIRNLKELGGIALLGILMIALVLVENATILLALGLVSALGVVIVLTMIMSVMFATVSQHFRTYHKWSDLRVPLLAGLTMAILMIGVINFARYSFTGTWEGFVL